MSRCRSRKRHFDSRAAAEAALTSINRNPFEGRAYYPTRVVRCHCGQWTLTSRDGKTWGRGKQSRSQR